MPQLRQLPQIRIGRGAGERAEKNPSFRMAEVKREHSVVAIGGGARHVFRLGDLRQLHVALVLDPYRIIFRDSRLAGLVSSHARRPRGHPVPGFQMIDCIEHPSKPQQMSLDTRGSLV